MGIFLRLDKINPTFNSLTFYVIDNRMLLLLEWWRVWIYPVHVVEFPTFTYELYLAKVLHM